MLLRANSYLQRFFRSMPKKKKKSLNIKYVSIDGEIKRIVSLLLRGPQTSSEMYLHIRSVNN